MTKYNANNIAESFAEIIKTAAPPSSLVKRPPVRDFGEPEIIPANNPSSGGGTDWAGVAGMAGGAVATDLAIMGVAKAAGAAGLSFPPLWPTIAVGAALIAAGGAMYGIYNMIEQTDDNVADLIDRMKALDYEGTDAETVITSWIDQLEGLRKTFAVPIGTDDPKEKYEALGNKIAAFEKGMGVLGSIYTTYHTYVKEQLKDWFGSWGDKGDFEQALKKTTANYKKRLNAMYAEFKKSALELHNPQEILKEILALEGQVKAMWAAPVYNEKEQVALEFARKGGSPKEVKQNLPALLKLRNDLKNKILPLAKKKKQQYTRRAEVDQPISKRAVELPDEPTAQIKRKPKGTGIRKNDVVLAMQERINDLSRALGVFAGGGIREDGMYGPNTANAVAALIDKFQQIPEEEKAQYPMRADLVKNLQARGLTIDLIKNWKAMNQPQHTRHLNQLSNAIKDVWNEHTGRGAGQRGGYRDQPGASAPGTMQPGQQGPGVSVQDFNRGNPNDATILAYLKSHRIQVGGEMAYIYDYMQQYKRWSDQTMVSFVRGLFGDKMPPANYSTDIIADRLGSRYSVLG